MVHPFFVGKGEIMSDFRRYPQGTSRTLIDANKVLDRLANAGDVFICLPVGLLDIIRKLLIDRGLWKTTYVMSNDDFGYVIPTEAQFNPIRQAIVEFLEETNIMRCEDFISALNGIRAAIAQCCGSAGPGQVQVGEELYYGTQQPLEKPTTFGEGQEFETEEEFNAHLCEFANDLVSAIIQSLNGWSILTAVLVLAGAVGVALFVANPPLAIFIAFVAAGFVFAGFHTLANYIADHREDWVCAIYRADGYAAVLAAIDEVLQTALTDLDLLDYQQPMEDLFHAMISTDFMNQAYQAIGLPEPFDPVDCSQCPVDLEITVEADPSLPAADVSYTGTAEAPVDGYNVIRITATRTDGDHRRVLVRTDNNQICIWMGWHPVSVYLPQGYIEGDNCNNDYIQPYPDGAINCWALYPQSQTEETFVYDVCLAQSQQAILDWVATL